MSFHITILNNLEGTCAKAVGLNITDYRIGLNLRWFTRPQVQNTTRSNASSNFPTEHDRETQQLIGESTNIHPTSPIYCAFFSFFTCFTSFPPAFDHSTAPTTPTNPSATAATVPIWIIPALLLSSTGTSIRAQVPFALAPTTGAGAGDKW